VTFVVVGLAALVMTAACGGASSGAALIGPGAGGGSGAVTPCTGGTVASYIGTSCSEVGGSVVYQWVSYSCTSVPAAICAALGTNGSNLRIDLDPNGPNTLLIGRTSLWNVTAGQSMDVVIRGTVYGAATSGNWPHFDSLSGQSGDGTEENITTVGCAASGNCLDAKNGMSDILCSAAGPPANCTDQTSIGPYFAYRATFNPATAANPYALTIEIKLDGNAGTATLYSIGTHLSP